MTTTTAPSKTAPSKCSPGNSEDIAELDAPESKEKVDFLSMIIQSSPIPQFAIDWNHRVIGWNRALEEFGGIRAADIIGTNQQWKVFYDAERPCLADILVDGAINKLPTWYQGKYSKSRFVDDAYEAIDFFPKMGASGKWLSFTAAPIRDSKGRIIGAIETLEDITERKRAEEAMRTFGEDLDRRVIERTSDLSDVNLKLMMEIVVRLNAEKQLTKTVGEKEVLLREVHHRVKNNLQIIISLLSLQSRYITDETTLFAFRESQNRIKAMALVHEKLYQSTDISRINLDDYIRFLGNNLFQLFGMNGKGITLTMDVRDIFLAIDTAIPIGLMINELISNSLKYAFPGGREGEISLAIQREDHTLTILFKDNGVGIPQDFDWRNAKSLGLRLVIGLVEQLQGTIELDRSAGTVFTIVVQEKQ
jgi:two-component sensor histidine kinase